MAHFLTIPTNENGVMFDPSMKDIVSEAIADDPFAFEDVFLYSHGWSTDADQAMDSYNRFSTDLARQLLILGRSVPPIFGDAPRNALGIGIHWPSEITENATSALNVAQLLTFYTMEHRADAVGKNAVYSMLRLMLQTRAASRLPLRMFLLGHSFGCKVVLAALQDLRVDMVNGTIATPHGLSFHVVLLEPATDEDNLDPGDIYGDVCRIPNLRMLITKSNLDTALTTWFVDAGRLVNFFNPRHALGAVGPTLKTTEAFGGASTVSIVPGFRASQVMDMGDKMVVADLTPVHEDRKATGAYVGGFSGSHSDIYFSEVYYLIAGFLFGRSQMAGASP